MAEHRIFDTAVADVYPHYVAKAERKGRTAAEVDEIIRWLTGYDDTGLERQLTARKSFRDFFGQAPMLNPARQQITGVVCGIRVETINDPLMREIRYLDKLVDELAKGKPLERIFRSSGQPVG